MPLSPEDRLAIVETIARYCHATDSGDGVGVADQFTEDGILEITGAWQAKGRAQIEQIGNFPNKPKHWTNSIVVDGTGSTAQSTVYYAAVRGGGPLYATGRYDSRLTKQFNGQWKLVHHCYTGDPVERPAPARSADNPDLLRAADRLQIIELIARFDAALQRGDGETVGQLFTAQGTWQNGTDPVQPGSSLSSASILRQAKGSRWTTNYIIEGNGHEARVRAYFALIDGDAIVETGLYDSMVSKVNDQWLLAAHHFIADVLPQGANR